jgi:hypothetical protein
MALETYQGSCHCGAVRFEARIDLSQGTIRCNCSNCWKARSWFVTVPRAQAHFHQGADELTEYTWLAPGKPKPFLHFRFCKKCGVRTFGVGGDEGQPGGFYFINVAALDVDPEVLAAAPLRFVDGKHDRYNEAPADTRLL